MKLIHVSQVDAHYWLAILLTSVFGTNMGDLYAHDSGLASAGGCCSLRAW